MTDTLSDGYPIGKCGDISMKQIIRKILYYFAVYFVAGVGSVIAIYPLLFTLNSSFKNNEEVFSSMFGLPKALRLENYADAFAVANIDKALLNSVFISGASVLLLLLIGSMASYVLSRYKYRFNNALLLYFTMGIMIPAQCVLIPVVEIVNRAQGRNSYLAMITIYAALNLPLTVFIISGYMRTISKEIDESAIIDGCGPFRLLMRIIMPIAMPGLSTAAIISFLYIYNELIFASVFLSQKSMYTVPIALLSFKGKMDLQIGPTFAAVMLSIFPIVAFYLIFQSKVEKGLTAGAVKG